MVFINCNSIGTDSVCIVMLLKRHISFSSSRYKKSNIPQFFYKVIIVHISIFLIYKIFIAVKI